MSDGPTGSAIAPAAAAPVGAPSPARRTLARPFTVSGLTLFLGVQASVTVRPHAASEGAGGFVFRRTDLAGSPPIPASIGSVVQEARRTVLSADPTNPRAPSVQTVEHLLSALVGMGVTDAAIDLTGPEVPLGDGSALVFVEAIQAAGVIGLHATPSITAARVIDPIRLSFGQAFVEALPPTQPGLELIYQLDYTGPAASPAAIPTQSAALVVPPDGPPIGYAAEIAPARTFCLLEEAQAMRTLGLFKHLEPKDMLVIGEAGPIDNSYRFPNEPARHKLLDLLGDLTLAGRPVHARIVAHRTGHAHNHALAAALAALP